jgi:HEAT repeat protein
MDIQEILIDKQIKPGDKTEMIARQLLEGKLSLKLLTGKIRSTSDAARATCIEAVELATRACPTLADIECLRLMTETLGDKAPRVKWESARVIGNIAHLFPSKLDEAISKLLTNTTHPGTVVRWSAAYAISRIIRLRLNLNKELLPVINTILESDEKNSIKKIYAEAVKSLKK